MGILVATTRPGTITAALLRPATVHLAALILQAVSKLLNSTKGEMVFFLCATLSTITVLLPAAVTFGTAIMVVEPAEPYRDYCARLIQGKVLRLRCAQRTTCLARGMCGVAHLVEFLQFLCVLVTGCGRLGQATVQGRPGTNGRWSSGLRRR